MLVGLCGWQGSGKTTVANYLKSKGFIEVSFADPLKSITAKILDISEEVLRAETPELRELRETRLCPDFGMSGRKGLETIGTIFREHFHPETWIIIAFRAVIKLLKEGKSVVISDVRHLNEFWRLSQYEGQLWYIVRDETKTILTDEMKKSHPSKWNHLLFAPHGTRINNLSTIEELYVQIDALLE